MDDWDIEGRQEELEKAIEGTKGQYSLVSYKYPVARFGGKELEENITITLYENTNIARMAVAEESIKGLSSAKLAYAGAASYHKKKYGMIQRHMSGASGLEVE
ncbi:hypothetical protein IMSAGC019_03585 [Lachnospiraceae bacterium]|nr:hypothetical protein IMSAGC019_03585 [Lachnospiraceae bacterium]